MELKKLNRKLFISYIFFMLFLSNLLYAEDNFRIKIGEESDATSITKSIDKIPKEHQYKLSICSINDDKFILTYGGKKTKQELQNLISEVPKESSPEIVPDTYTKCYKLEYFLAEYSKMNTNIKKVQQEDAESTKKAEEESTYLKLPEQFNKKEKKEEEKLPKKETTKLPPPTLSDIKNTPEMLTNTVVKVYPDITTRLDLSTLDINRCTCMDGSPVKDVVRSSEKGITAQVNGNNVFIKFQIQQNQITQDTKYSETPTDLYILCGETIYPIIAIPKKIPAQWVQLMSNKSKIEKTVSSFKGLSYEEKIVTIMKEAYSNMLSDNYTKQKVEQKFTIHSMNFLEIVLKQIINIDGEGMILKEFFIKVKPDAKSSIAKVTEKNFITPDISQKPLAITLDSLVITKNKPTRLWIIEKNFNEQTLKKM
ncbi:MAG: type-F conjugative transfer system secretin TraK [Desulfobacterales bacterium]|nr:type-F conjugative transfer system secretin TraK [Desulfobacterales bacterium]